MITTINPSGEPGEAHTINPSGEPGEAQGPPFVELLRRMRLDVFATAMQAGVDLIFTNNSAWGAPDGSKRFEAFTYEAAHVVESAGGVALSVRVTAPLDVLESRVGNESRRAHGKLADVDRLRELVAGMDEPQLRASDLIVDTAELTADEAAQVIASAVGSASARIAVSQ